jgi:hypothetical protein
MVRPGGFPNEESKKARNHANYPVLLSAEQNLLEPVTFTSSKAKPVMGQIS